MADVLPAPRTIAPEGRDGGRVPGRTAPDTGGRPRGGNGAMGIRTPRASTVGLAALVAGSVVGAAMPLVSAAVRPWRLGEFDPAGLRVAEGVAVPELQADTTLHAFGTMPEGSERRHAFVIRNVGEAPLKITRGATSCSCTVSDFEDTEGGDRGGEVFVAPGESTILRLMWRGKNGGPFRQHATVFTNDPRRPEIEFAVEGFVVPVWKAEPKAMILAGISSQGGAKASSMIFTYGPEQPTVAAVAVADPESPQILSLATRPLEPNEYRGQRGATGGVMLEVEVLPGVPLGPLHTTIHVDLRLPEETRAELTLDATVVGDLALAGPGWDSSLQVLKLGTVSARTGLQSQLFITSKGPHRESIRPVVREVVPSSMKVEVGEGAAVGTGSVMRFPLTISIPSGSPPVNHLGSSQAPAGRIVLDTGHPESPSMTIPVSVAIGP